MLRWWPAKDGDPDGRRLMARHYSRRRYGSRRPSKLFVGPGGKHVFVTADGLAVFVWRKFIDKCPLGGGINCSIFRNEGPGRSSDLILEAEREAWHRWPGERLYTYVDPREIRSKNPGYCFKCAGWRFCGVTAGGLHCLEKLPSSRAGD